MYFTIYYKFYYKEEQHIYEGLNLVLTKLTLVIICAGTVGAGAETRWYSGPSSDPDIQNSYIYG
jgi:hypothetical protein